MPREVDIVPLPALVKPVMVVFLPVHQHFNSFALIFTNKHVLICIQICMQMYSLYEHKHMHIFSFCFAVFMFLVHVHVPVCK